MQANDPSFERWLRLTDIHSRLLRRALARPSASRKLLNAVGNAVMRACCSSASCTPPGGRSERQSTARQHWNAAPWAW